MSTTSIVIKMVESLSTLKYFYRNTISACYANIIHRHGLTKTDTTERREYCVNAAIKVLKTFGIKEQL